MATLHVEAPGALVIVSLHKNRVVLETVVPTGAPDVGITVRAGDTVMGPSLVVAPVEDCPPPKKPHKPHKPHKPSHKPHKPHNHRR